MNESHTLVGVNARCEGMQTGRTTMETPSHQREIERKDSYCMEAEDQEILKRYYCFLYFWNVDHRKLSSSVHHNRNLMKTNVDDDITFKTGVSESGSHR